MNNPYETLEVEKDATPEQIKAAYRKMANKHHPDKDTGDIAKFQEIQAAYELLSDPERRKHYDDTGLSKQAPDFEEMLRAERASLILQMVDMRDPTRQDLVQGMRQSVMHGKAQATQALYQIEAQCKRREDAAGRVSHKAGETNLLRDILLADLAQKRTIAERVKADLGKYDQLLAKIDEYAYECQPPATSTASTISNPYFTLDMQA